MNEPKKKIGVESPLSQKKGDGSARGSKALICISGVHILYDMGGCAYLWLRRDDCNVLDCPYVLPKRLYDLLEYLFCVLPVCKREGGCVCQASWPSWTCRVGMQKTDLMMLFVVRSCMEAFGRNRCFFGFWCLRQRRCSYSRAFPYFSVVSSTWPPNVNKRVSRGPIWGGGYD